ncbi:MAG: hypothetical protein NTU53_09080 [Planctomycetota bacterium]|nr:hypothetical protein [Planctomycetota bacterium]
MNPATSLNELAQPADTPDASLARPATTCSSSPRNLSWTAPVIAALLVAVVPALLWPGDAPWVWDEPLEVAIALAANQQHQLATHGLSGGFPFPYGPLGIQALQLCLLFTHDPRVLVVYHALLCAVPTALALLWLARTLRLPPWFAVAVLASPYLWFEARRLWQPSFCIPLGVMAIAAYASFLKTRARRSLLLAITCAIAPLFIHLQSLPLSLAILGHLLLRHRADLWRHRWMILGILVVLGTLNCRYLFTVNWCFIHYLPQYLRIGHNSNTPFANAWWTPFLAGNLFSGQDWMTSPHLLARAARYLSSIPIPLVWIGIALAAWHLLLRRGNPSRSAPRPRATDPHPSLLPAGTPRRTILAVALAGLAIQILLCAVLRLSSTHHYYFGTFGFHVLFAWIAVAALPRPLWRGLVIAVYALSAAAVSVYSIDQVHRHSWPRWFCPTLNEQIAVATALNAYTDRFAHTEVPAYCDRPEVLGILRLLYPPHPAQSQRHSGRLVIRFRPAHEGTSDRIELVETDPIPLHARRIPLNYPPPP